MIYILSGDDITTSRKRLVELNEDFPTTILDGKTTTLMAIEESLLSSGLFEDKKSVVIENVTKNPKKKEILYFLNDLKTEVQIILWEEKKALKTSFSALKSAKKEEYLLPTYYFKFLDSISPKNKKEVFVLYQKLLATYAPEQVFYSMLRRARQLVVLSAGVRTDEIAKMSSWQLSNLKRQLQMWNSSSLNSFYDSLRQTEIKLKSGGLPVTLSKHLDILLLSKL